MNYVKHGCTYTHATDTQCSTQNMFQCQRQLSNRHFITSINILMHACKPLHVVVSISSLDRICTIRYGHSEHESKQENSGECH